LPVELLSYIFSLSTHATIGEFSAGLDEEDHHHHHHHHAPPIITTESVRVPLVLSSVSRLWQQVALGTPHLWSSLCITPELIEYVERDPHAHSVSGQLNTSHITSYLVRSRKCPLNILIDARDENWSFEPELVSDHGVEDLYTPFFTSEHMDTVFALLLPHLSRWKSLSILTDCWAPMYTALTVINPFITRFGAPLLESLSLMRCNDLISFAPRFQPHQLKEPAFLKSGTRETHPDIEWCPNMLPSLKHLSLRGVHVDWDALGDSLSTIPEDAVAASTVLHHDHVPAHLPHLRNITVGYRTAMEGRVALELIDAPNVKELSLEDASYAGDPDVANAGPLLSYIGTRQFGAAHQNHRIIAYEAVGYQAAALVTDKASCTDVNKATESRAAFPLLERVTLRGVRTCSEPLRLFLGALSNLQHLELTRMSMQAMQALLPSDPITHDDGYSAGTKCPCPQLRSLCIRGFEQLDVRDADFIVGGLAAERQNKGACELREVDIHVDATQEMMACVLPLPLVGSPNMKVNIIVNDSSSDEEEEEDYEDGQDIMGLDPYELGGAFNDPLFDAYYSSHFQIAR